MYLLAHHDPEDEAIKLEDDEDGVGEDARAYVAAQDVEGGGGVVAAEMPAPPAVAPSADGTEAAKAAGRAPRDRCFSRGSRAAAAAAGAARPRHEHGRGRAGAGEAAGARWRRRPASPAARLDSDGRAGSVIGRQSLPGARTPHLVH